MKVFYALNFEKVGDILVPACPYVCMYVCMYVCIYVRMYVFMFEISSWNFMYGFLMEK